MAGWSRAGFLRLVTHMPRTRTREGIRPNGRVISTRSCIDAESDGISRTLCYSRRHAHDIVGPHPASAALYGGVLQARDTLCGDFLEPGFSESERLHARNIMTYYLLENIATMAQ